MAARIIFTLSAFTLSAIIQCLAGLGSKYVIVLTGMVVPLLTYGLWTLFDSENNLKIDLFLPGVSAVIGIVIGGAVRWILQHHETLHLDILAVLLGAVGSGILIFLRQRSANPRCEICREPLTSGFYTCPRCSQVVCQGSSCWYAEYYRCTDCQRFQRPIFPLENDWWQHRLGTQTTRGRCSRCQRTGDEIDLRQCRNCEWPMCKQCWDLENGQCFRCSWIIPELPESLQGVVELQNGIKERKRA